MLNSKLKRISLALVLAVVLTLSLFTLSAFALEDAGAAPDGEQGIVLDVSENPGIDVAESEDYFSIAVAIDAAKRAAEEIIQNETFATQEYVDDKVERLRVSIDEELEAVEDDSKTFYVTIVKTESGTFEADQPVNLVIGAYESGRNVKAIIEIDRENVSVPLIGIIEGDTASYAGYGAYGNYVIISQTDNKISLSFNEIITQEHLDQINAQDVGAIPVPLQAQLGQTVVVSEVDENGKPTAWEAANFPAGGGIKLPELIASGTMEEEGFGFDITKDNDGNPFELVTAILYITNLTPPEGTTSDVLCKIMMRGAGGRIVYLRANATQSAKKDKITIVYDATRGMMYAVQDHCATMISSGGEKCLYPVNRVDLQGVSTWAIVGAGLTYELWGVRK
jgi:hypothetical protein